MVVANFESDEAHDAQRPRHSNTDSCVDGCRYSLPIWSCVLQRNRVLLSSGVVESDVRSLGALRKGKILSGS